VEKLSNWGNVERKAHESGFVQKRWGPQERGKLFNTEILSREGKPSTHKDNKILLKGGHKKGKRRAPRTGF